MIVRMKTVYAGPQGGFDVGQEVRAPEDIPIKTAQALVDGGFADVVDVRAEPREEKIEREQVEPQEQAMQKRRGRPKKVSGDK